MNGQARKLAERAAARPRRFPLPAAVLASGKGGVGKTSLAVALAIALARAGRRVLLIDLDLGLSNVDVLLGLAPQATVADLLAGERRFEDCLVRGPEGIEVLPAASGVAKLAAAGPAERRRLFEALGAARGRYDLLVADAGAGVSPNVLDFFVASDLGLLVTTPEPMAFTDAYALLKLVALSDRSAAGRMKLVLNRTATPEEGARIAGRLREVARKFLSLEIDTLGNIPEDAAVSEAAKRQRPFSIESPLSPAARAIDLVAAAAAARLFLEGGAQRSSKGAIS